MDRIQKWKSLIRASLLMTSHPLSGGGIFNGDDGLETASMFGLDSFINGLGDPKQASFFPTLESIFNGNIMMIIHNIIGYMDNTTWFNESYILDKPDKMPLTKARIEELEASKQAESQTQTITKSKDKSKDKWKDNYKPKEQKQKQKHKSTKWYWW